MTVADRLSVNPIVESINLFNGVKKMNEDVNVTDEQDFDPVAEIKAIKDNTVPKEDYDKIVAEKDKYLKALIEGAQVDSPAAEPADVKQLRADLFGNGEELDNLTYCRKALELREALIEQEGVDIFVGRGSKLTPTAEDYEAAQRVADVMQTCIDESNGDSSVFTAMLMSKTKDVVIPGKKINPKIKR